jgi:uncharacterized RDD family membrane protein YckC
MNEQILDSPLNRSGELVYAGFWVRVAALIIDSLVVGLAIGVFFGIAMVLMPDNPVGMVLLVYGVGIPAGFAYYVLLESSSKQGTLGKQAMGIKVGKANGERITGLNALGRLFARWLSGMILYIGYIMVAFDAKKQGLHDKLANTYVFYAR